MKRGRERTLEAYRDGALSEADRARIERALELDPESAGYVQRGVALGALIREAWSEGPSAQPADRLLASIAPEMRKIDAERAPKTALGRSVGQLGAWVRDVLEPVGRPWIAAAGAAAAAAVAVLMADPTTLDPRGALQQMAAVARVADGTAPQLPIRLASEGSPKFIGELGWPSAVYDLAQEDVPLMVSEKDGAIVILLGDPEPPPSVDDISGSVKLEGMA